MQNLKLMKIKNLFMIGSIVIIGWLLLYVFSHIYFNPSSSEVRGYYFVYKANKYSVNDRVLLCVKDGESIKILRKLGLTYVSDKCPGNMPYLLKKIVAIPGDNVLLTRDGVRVNGVLQPNSVSFKKFKLVELNPLAIQQEFKLKEAEYFVIGRGKRSYDSRYFGIIRGSDIYYKAILIYSIDN